MNCICQSEYLWSGRLAAIKKKTNKVLRETKICFANMSEYDPRLNPSKGLVIGALFS